MKRSTVIYAMLALALTACNNDENLDNPNAPVELRLTSGLEVQTRAASYTQSTSLVAGEKVYAWVDDAGNNNPEYQARELTATADEVFTYEPMYFPQTGNGVSIYALHGKFDPSFNENDAFPSDGVVFSVAADQSGMGTAYTNSDLLYATKQDVARTKDQVELTFYHMLSKMEIAIVRGEGAPELANDDAVTIADVVTDGTFKPTKAADMTDQAARQAMIEAGGRKEQMVVSQRTSPNFGEANVDYNEVIVVPQDMLGKKIEFKLAKGGTLSYTIPAFDGNSGRAVFESGKKYIYHITLNLTGVEVSASIENWGNDGRTTIGNAEME